MERTDSTHAGAADEGIMSTKKFLKVGAMFILGLLAISTIIIIRMSHHLTGNGSIMLLGIIGLCLLWHGRRKIFTMVKTYVDEAIKEDPLAIGTIAMAILMICIIGGGGAYRFLGGAVKDLEPFFYPLGVAVVVLTFLGVKHYTDTTARESERDDHE